MPPDQDALRDIGLAQGFLDGNWFGDPSYPGATRHYPPLVSALAAAAAELAGAQGDLPGFWIAVGPWANLAVPLCFFVMARRIFGDAAVGAVACLVFVLWNGAMGPPWTTGGYSPWLFVPGVAQAFFFLSVALIHAKVGSGRWSDAALVGAAVGATFLAHPVPAVVLTAVVAAAAFAAQGVRPRTVAWLALAAAAQLALMAPYLLPVTLLNPAGIVNDAPGRWTDPLLQSDAGAVAAAALLNTPGVCAAVLAWRLDRLRRLDRRALAILSSWAAACLFALGRHYACEAVRAPDGTAPGACAVFVLTIHHYHLYLQVAWTCLIGYALAALLSPPARASGPSPPGRPWTTATALAAAALVSVGAAAFLSRPYDRAALALALDHPNGHTMDLAAYRWVVANTGPGDLFVTGPSERGPLLDAAVFTVLASGRAAAALPPPFSNPHLRWGERDESRRRHLAAALEGDVPMPCAPAGQTVYLLLPAGSRRPDPARAEAVFSSGHHTVSRVRAPTCAPGRGGAG